MVRPRRLNLRRDGPARVNNLRPRNLDEVRNRRYRVDELVDMVALYFENDRVAYRAAAAYRERFPNRNKFPDAAVITDTVDRFLRTGSVLPVGIDAGGQLNVEVMEIAEAEVQEDPRTSVRKIQSRTGYSKSAVNRALIELDYHPYHFTRVQRLMDHDPASRLVFCRRLLEELDVEPTLLSSILWTDESTFTESGVFNAHNSHYYAQDNPNLYWDSNSQYKFKVNLWCGIIGDELIGPVFLEENLNGQRYLEFLENELPQLLFPPDNVDDMPLARRNVLFMHDGCPAHGTRLVTAHLNATFGHRWMGQRSPHWRWPARSCDLTPCDFYLFGAQKNEVYATPVRTREELIQRINESFARINRDHLRKATESVARRAQMCIEMNGGHFQHYL